MIGKSPRCRSATDQARAVRKPTARAIVDSETVWAEVSTCPAADSSTQISANTHARHARASGERCGGLVMMPSIVAPLQDERRSRVRRGRCRAHPAPRSSDMSIPSVRDLASLRSPAADRIVGRTGDMVPRSAEKWCSSPTGRAAGYRAPADLPRPIFDVVSPCDRRSRRSLFRYAGRKRAHSYGWGREKLSTSGNR